MAGDGRLRPEAGSGGDHRTPDTLVRQLLAIDRRAQRAADDRDPQRSAHPEPYPETGIHPGAAQQQRRDTRPVAGRGDRPAELRDPAGTVGNAVGTRT